MRWVEAEGGMLFKRRCNRTGVINFFSYTEPFLAAGSIVQISSGAPISMMIAWELRGTFQSLKPISTEPSAGFITAA